MDEFEGARKRTLTLWECQARPGITTYCGFNIAERRRRLQPAKGAEARPAPGFNCFEVCRRVSVRAVQPQLVELLVQVGPLDSEDLGGFRYVPVGFV